MNARVSGETRAERGQRIIAVTPNPAVDVTYRLDRVRLDEVNRVAEVTRRAGGKGVNVASVLEQLGVHASLSGFVGGNLGAVFHDLLSRSSVGDARRQQWVEIDGTTRATTVVFDPASTTLFNEPGPAVRDAEWHSLSRRLTELCGPGDVVVISGSLPPGTEAATLRGLLEAVKARGAALLVDTSGPMLKVAAEAGADLLKPNHDELAEATGKTSVAEGARDLLGRGARAVAVSCGRDGLEIYRAVDENPPGGTDGRTRTRGWRAAPAEVVSGNATGAGDSAVAALALALSAISAGDDPSGVWPEYLRRAVALSGAAVLAPVAGVVDLAAYERFQKHIEVEEINVFD